MSAINPVYKKPVWQIVMDGQDLASRINPRFMDLTVHESRGDEADQMDLTLSDHDGLLEIPSRQAKIQLAIGWNDTGLVDKGQFIVDEVSHRGAPDVITIRARSADMKGKLRTRREQSFHNQTIGSIVDRIALANGLVPVVGQDFAGKMIPHIDQSKESDLAFLTRLGKRYDAVATVKEGRLLFMPITGGRTASGVDLSAVDIYRKDGDSHDFMIAERDSYTGVKATWVDPASSVIHTVIAGDKENAKQLRDSYTNASDASAAAQAEWKRIQRGAATMRFNMAWGMPELSVQNKIRFPDFKKPINEITWLVKELSHSINGSGLTTSLDLEKV